MVMQPAQTNQTSDSPAMAHMRDGSATYEDYKNYNNEMASHNSMSPQTNQSIPQGIGDSEQDMAAPGMGADATQDPATQAVQQRLDSLPDHDKQFLAQYLTPEFVYALGLISPEAGQYLGQFTDQNKVLVPVDRQEAAKIQDAIKEYQQSGQGPGPSNAPSPTVAHEYEGNGQQVPIPQRAQNPAPNGQQDTSKLNSQIASKVNNDVGAKVLPNGVTPAPMQHGIMAPR